MSGLDETVQQRRAARLAAGSDTPTASNPLPVNLDRVCADYALYVEGWADACTQAGAGVAGGRGATCAILAACRVADAVPGLLAHIAELTEKLTATDTPETPS